MPTNPAPVLAEFIPAALRARPAWVVWRMEDRDGRPTKVPYNVKGRTRAKSDDPLTWGTFPDALLAYQDFDGVGIMLAGGDVTCIDLDHCITDGVIDEWAVTLIAKVDSYTETSQSGEGLHVFVRGTPPAGRRRKGTVEMYGPNDNRYIAVTGQRVTFAGAKILNRDIVDCDLEALHAELFPFEQSDAGNSRQAGVTALPLSPPMTDDAVIEHAEGARNAAKLEAIRSGDYSAYPSPSEARMAAVSILGFYTQDIDQLVRLCEGMGFDRPEDERKMRNHDIPHALETLSATYQPGSASVIKHGGEPCDACSGVPNTECNRIAADLDAAVIVAETRAVDFPFDTLPAPLRALAENGGAASGCAPEAVAVHGLSVLGAAIGSTATLHIGSWKQKPVIWSAVVARAGTAKSTALKLATAPLEAWDVAQVAHTRDMASDGKTVTEAKRTLADDTTSERLAMLLQANPRGLLVAADELAGVVTGLNQYKGGKGNDRQLYLKLWSGSSLRVDRVSRDAIFVAAPVCAVTGGIQPARLDLLSGDDGMTGRWLVAYLEAREITEPTDADLDHEARAWAAAVGALLSRQGGVDYAMTNEAYEAFRDWRRGNIKRTNAEQNPQRADYLGKLQSHMARLVLLLHVADDPHTHETHIGVGVVDRARRLLDYFVEGAMEHITTTTRDPGRAAYDNLDQAADDIRAWLRKHPKATKRDAARAHVAGLRTAATFAAGWKRYEEIYGAA